MKATATIWTTLFRFPSHQRLPIHLTIIHFIVVVVLSLYDVFHRMNRTINKMGSALWIQNPQCAWIHVLKWTIYIVRVAHFRKKKQQQQQPTKPKKNLISTLADSIKLINHRSVILLLLVLLPIWTYCCKFFFIHIALHSWFLFRTTCAF